MADNDTPASAATTIADLQHSLQEGQAAISGSLAANQASLDAGWAAEAQRSHNLDQVFDSLNGPTPGFVTEVAGDQHGGEVIDAVPAMDAAGPDVAPEDLGQVLVSALAAGDFEGAVEVIEAIIDEAELDADDAPVATADADTPPTAADMTFDGSQ